MSKESKKSIVHASLSHKNNDFFKDQNDYNTITHPTICQNQNDQDKNDERDFIKTPSYYHKSMYKKKDENQHSHKLSNNHGNPRYNKANDVVSIVRDVNHTKSYYYDSSCVRSVESAPYGWKREPSVPYQMTGIKSEPKIQCNVTMNAKSTSTMQRPSNFDSMNSNHLSRENYPYEIDTRGNTPMALPFHSQYERADGCDRGDRAYPNGKRKENKEHFALDHMHDVCSRQDNMRSMFLPIPFPSTNMTPIQFHPCKSPKHYCLDEHRQFDRYRSDMNNMFDPKMSLSTKSNVYPQGHRLIVPSSNSAAKRCRSIGVQTSMTILTTEKNDLNDKIENLIPSISYENSFTSENDEIPPNIPNANASSCSSIGSITSMFFEEDKKDVDLKPFEMLELNLDGVWNAPVPHDLESSGRVCLSCHSSSIHQHSQNTESSPKHSEPFGSSLSPNIPNAMSTQQKSIKRRIRRPCSVIGCSNRVVQGGLCIRHGAKRKKCSFPGCVKHVKKAGRCSTHGPRRKQCHYEGCRNVSVKGGRCISHGAKKKEHDKQGMTCQTRHAFLVPSVEKDLHDLNDSTSSEL